MRGEKYEEMKEVEATTGGIGRSESKSEMGTVEMRPEGAVTLSTCPVALLFLYCRADHYRALTHTHLLFPFQELLR